MWLCVLGARCYPAEGSPFWDPGVGNFQIKVGNGGLSFRKKSAMLRVLDAGPYPKIPNSTMDWSTVSSMAGW